MKKLFLATLMIASGMQISASNANSRTYQGQLMDHVRAFASKYQDNSDEKETASTTPASIEITSPLIQASNSNNTDSRLEERIEIGKAIKKACKHSAFSNQQDIQKIANKFCSSSQGYDLIDTKNSCSALLSFLDNESQEIFETSKNVQYFSYDEDSNHNLAGRPTVVLNDTKDPQSLKVLVQNYYDKISDDGSNN